MKIYNTSSVSLTYDLEGRQVEAHSPAITKMNPAVQKLLETGKVITVQKPSNKVVLAAETTVKDIKDTVVLDLDQAGYKVTNEKDPL